MPSPLRHLFDYLPPAEFRDHPGEFWKPGLRLRVPFGRRQVVAMLVGTSDSSELPYSQLKQATEVLDDEPLFELPLLRTLNWAAAYYQHPPGEVFSAALPARLRQGTSTAPDLEKVWAACQSSTATTDRLLHRAPRQRELLDKLRLEGPLTPLQCRQAGFSDTVIKGLEERRLVRQQHRTAKVAATCPVADDRIPKAAPRPNPEQQAAIETISESLNRFHCYLLDGVTGSGKTEVYMQVIARVLAQNRQVLVLVPEIGLTPQSVGSFRERFRCDIVLLHSGLTDSERLAGWNRSRNGDAGITLGTRSAVFTPMARPGLIIIDEEHDGSFKQQDGFRYSARDLAIYRAREEQVNIILGSATPSLESLHNARSGRFTHLRLKERAGSAEKPPVTLLDINEDISPGGLSQPLLEQISHHLQRRNQVLVFINRRGFAPSLICRNCGFIFECPRCDALLVPSRYPLRRFPS